ncbi:ash family protein [Lonsdalea quercina]|uniref:ash family protein n=1 Tax=Lonsdalea quercina TaxID=71657 RepID=UPI003975D5D8
MTSRRQRTRQASFYVVVLTNLCLTWGALCLYVSQIMVAQAGASSEAPVSLKSGTANPVWATTHEICSSSGSFNYYFKESPHGYHPRIATSAVSLYFWSRCPFLSV